MLRRFLEWAAEDGRNYIDPITMPKLKKNRTGTNAINRPRIEIATAQAEAVLAALPERTAAGHPIRALMTVVWDTSLRIEGVQRLEVPKHYQKGSRVLVITDDIDKGKYGRPLPLTPRAQAALDSVAEQKGLLFGKWAYLKALRKAAKQVGMGDYACRYLDARDFRHGALTAFGESSRSVARVAYMGRGTRICARARVTSIRGFGPGNGHFRTAFWSPIPVTAMRSRPTK